MSVDPDSHDASILLRGMTVKRDGYMAPINTAFNACVATRMGVAGPTGAAGAAGATPFNAIDGLLPGHRGESNL